VKSGKLILILALASVLLFVLYEVNFIFDIVLPAETESPDPEVEMAFTSCYQLKDDQIHATAFGTIDNPDVQKEFISSSQARAAAECRAAHPERILIIEQPGRLNLVDLTPRFW
jgi:hypothetical protein